MVCALSVVGCVSAACPAGSESVEGICTADAAVLDEEIDTGAPEAGGAGSGQRNNFV